jgi:hypothetical protein
LRASAYLHDPSSSGARRTRRLAGTAEGGDDTSTRTRRIVDETDRFAASPGKLHTRLLIMLATKEPWPDWVTVAPDQGWGDRADTILVCDVPADFLKRLFR